MLDTNALTSTANAKEALNITGATYDNLIERLINAASDAIEMYCDRTFKSATYTNEKYDGDGSNRIVLEQRPVTSITNIQYLVSDYASDDWETLDTDFYTFKANGVVYKTSHFSTGVNNWRVTYVAGYATIPHDIEEACIELVGYMFNASKATGKASETLGEYSVSWSPKKTAKIFDELGIDEILDQYKTPIVAGV